MVVENVTCMNAGDGESSYTNNSLLQKIVILKARPVLDATIKDLFRTTFPTCFRVADLGCSSGPNTLMMISEIIDTIHEICQQRNCRQPEYQVFLNDLPGNDFNSIFKSLPAFYERFKQDKEDKLGLCSISGTPGSFYGRLFPSKFLNFIHSSYSVHWLSQVPKGLANNKGNIYMANSSPPSVFKAYMEQFRRDFSMFLSLRSEEIVSGGRMVLTFIGRSTPDLTSKECCHHWELLAKSLLDLVAEGLVEEAGVDSFNIPYYTPYKEEVREIVQKEGSFNLDRLEILEDNWDPNNEIENQGSAYRNGINVANCIRAVTEPMLAAHFGDSIIDTLFARVSAMDDEDDMYYSCSDEDEKANDDSLADEIVQYSVESRRSEQNYTVLKESEILQRQEDEITRVSTVLSISKVAASVLLLHYNWSVSKVHDAWFADEERVRKSVGLVEEPVVEFSKQTSELITCGICFEKHHYCYIRSAACGHPFCSECWNGYITTSIKDGPGCLMLRCPDPSCIAAVGKDMVESLVSDKDNKEKYLCYLMRSYIESNRKSKWCPAPGCEYAIEFCGSDGNYDVCCLCSNMFCWNCMEDAHRPVDCGTVEKWVLKNNSEGENTLWIVANSKPCPNCKRPIEKNSGCMHMTCKLCRFEFCWLCLGPWSDHGLRTGGYFDCNRYNAAKVGGKYDEAENRRRNLKASLKKYAHYYERWAGNESSRQKAVRCLHLMQSVHMEKLSEIHSQSMSQLGFITEAWLQIVECRGVLKWTYAYVYYLPDNEKAKKHLFEYLQGQAEHGLEMLHRCAETDLYDFLTDGSSSENFNDFRNKLSGLTKVTRNYFENLVGALENGLSDVKSYGDCSKKKEFKRGEGEGSSKKGKKTIQIRSFSRY